MKKAQTMMVFIPHTELCPRGPALLYTVFQENMPTPLISRLEDTALWVLPGQFQRRIPLLDHFVLRSSHLLQFPLRRDLLHLTMHMIAVGCMSAHAPI